MFGHIISSLPSPPSQENLESTQALFTPDRGMINDKMAKEEGGLPPGEVSGLQGQRAQP